MPPIFIYLNVAPGSFLPYPSESEIFQLQQNHDTPASHVYSTQ